MWKAAYYRKQAETFLLMARLTRDEAKAARFTLLASKFYEKADRALAQSDLHPE
jgi:hypothetical protein